MREIIENLETELKINANSHIALKQKKYLRNQYEFFGLKANKRREIQKPFFLKEYLPEKRELSILVKTLWDKPQREFQHFAQELAFLFIKEAEEKDIGLYEYMVTHKSWWDTTDFIAIKLMGGYFKAFPEKKAIHIQRWTGSDDIWLQRSSLLFQLKYRNNLDTDLLSIAIHSLLPSKNFFITKAIGWVLREYSRTDPEWVTGFVNNTPLSPLSKKEALRLIK